MKPVKRIKGVHAFKWKRCPFCGYKNPLFARRCKECSFWFVKHCKKCGHPNSWEEKQCVDCKEPFYHYCREDGYPIKEQDGVGACSSASERHILYKRCAVCNSRYPPYLEKCPSCSIKHHKGPIPKTGGSS